MYFGQLDPNWRALPPAELSAAMRRVLRGLELPAASSSSTHLECMLCIGNMIMCVRLREELLAGAAGRPAGGAVGAPAPRALLCAPPPLPAPPAAASLLPAC